LPEQGDVRDRFERLRPGLTGHLVAAMQHVAERELA
jgi:hypothetical protein